MTPDRFEDFADVINRDRRANHCWCLSHRLRAGEVEKLGGRSREQAMRRLRGRDHRPSTTCRYGASCASWSDPAIVDEA